MAANLTVPTRTDLKFINKIYELRLQWAIENTMAQKKHNPAIEIMIDRQFDLRVSRQTKAI